jgi:hypothetical protein
MRGDTPLASNDTWTFGSSLRADPSRADRQRRGGDRCHSFSGVLHRDSERRSRHVRDWIGGNLRLGCSKRFAPRKHQHPGFVETGDNELIGGFITGPNDRGNAHVLVRAVGPTLNVNGVPVAGRLDDPTLDLIAANDVVLGANDDWKSTQQALIEATGLAPTNDKESAVLATLPPGAYTAIVRGVGQTTGIGLVEVYQLP